ncbi:hypothetical protein [Candidatus Vidania fulgoroideorum]
MKSRFIFILLFEKPLSAKTLGKIRRDAKEGLKIRVLKKTLINKVCGDKTISGYMNGVLSLLFFADNLEYLWDYKKWVRENGYVLLYNKTERNDMCRFVIEHSDKTHMLKDTIYTIIKIVICLIRNINECAKHI